MWIKKYKKIPKTKIYGKEVHLHEDQPLPTTRRDFLKTGLLQFSAIMTLPGLPLSLLKTLDANAAGTCGQWNFGQSDIMPLLHLCLEGGAALPQNIIQYTNSSGGLPTQNYKVAIGDNPTFASLSGATFNANGGFYRGITSVAGYSSVFNKTSICTVPVMTQDDNPENYFDLSGMLKIYFDQFSIKALLPPVENKYRAVHARSAFVERPSNLTIATVDDLVRAVNPPPPLGGIGKTGYEALTRTIRKLDQERFTELATRNISAIDFIRDNRVAAADKLEQNALLPTATVDPLSDNVLMSAFQNIWGIDPTTPKRNEDRLDASMLYCLLKNHMTSLTIQKGGFDYHFNQRSGPDQKDFGVGVKLTQYLQTAEAMNSPLMIVMTSDGGVLGPSGSRDPQALYVADNGTYSFITIFCYHPTGRPQVQSALSHLPHNQMGLVNDDASVINTSSVSARNTLNATQTVFLNLLSASLGSSNGVQSYQDVMSALGQTPFTSREIDEALRFTGNCA